MATLVLGAVGTALAGPLGGAIGALAGRQIDNAIIGPPAREGLRLTELAISSSSYGQPIPRHFGTVRAPGVIFWATDLVESKETSGGGKGKPKTTSYSYSVSLAVALSSTPIEGIGRVWADGNLLRGASGDLKTSGTLRIYNGTGDQHADPLIAAACQSEVPAMRGCAYAVFEDLSLGDFGNRIPALSFEIFERRNASFDLDELSDLPDLAGTANALNLLSGFSDPGGSIGTMLGTLDQVIPINCSTGPAGLSLALREDGAIASATLPAPLAMTDDATRQRRNGPSVQRGYSSHQDVGGLRYYDPDRDYQIGVQRATGGGRKLGDRILEFPATTSAGAARSLVSAMSKRQSWQSERILLSIAELDSQHAVGKLVAIPDQPGVWRIRGWEWMDRGVELELERSPPTAGKTHFSDAGLLTAPVDLQAQPTQLWAIELPPLDLSGATSGSYFAALTGEPGWNGASLYSDIDGSLASLELSARESSTVGTLVSDLNVSFATHLERNATIEIELQGSGNDLQSASAAAIAMGSNRLYIEGEIVQFANVEQVGARRYRLTGLLRGRAGTEHFANAVHRAGSLAILLDTGLVSLSTDSAIAAIGLGDSDPAKASLSNSGASTAPLSPTHTRRQVESNGDWRICWTRRARGAWQWLDHVDVPLVEEAESYLVGLGPVDQPLASWSTDTSELVFTAAEIADLSAQFGPAQLWVRQIGTFGQSPASFITHIQ